jgi:predicted nucleotide-binding protein
MAKKSTGNQGLEKPSLTISRAEALSKLEAQIKIGEDLLNRPPSYDPAFISRFEQDKKLWDTRNRYLLESIFSNEREKKAYSIKTAQVVVMTYYGDSYSNPQEELKDEIVHVNRILQSLREIASSLEFFEEPLPKKMEGDNLTLGSKISNNNVFIVHGHDNSLKIEVQSILRKLKLNPIILHEQENEGKTIIEKFEKHSEGAAFAVVLLTPDDLGRSSVAESDALTSRARQNVILELGYFMGSLGRGKVCALYKGDIELPSDYSGILYLETDKGEDWKFKLAKELKTAGLSVDLNDL